MLHPRPTYQQVGV